MRVLHITPAYHPATYWGGPIFSVYALNNALATFPDVDIKVLTTDTAGPRVAERLDTRGLESLYPNHEVIFTHRIAGACISAELLKQSSSLVRWADVVHLTATYSFPTIPTLLMCRHWRKPLIWSPRGAILEAYEWKGARRRGIKRVWEWVCNAIIRPRGVVLHVTSEEEKAASLARIPKAEAVIVKNGVDVPADLPECDWLPDGMMRLLFLGRLSPNKGIENLLEAMKRLDDPTMSLTLCGTGDMKYAFSLKELARRLDLLGRSVHFVGHVDSEAKRAAFLNADVCVVPSYSENFCIVVAEALANGMPVIASHGTPWREVEERQCGLWVNNDPESLVQAIRAIRGKNLEGMGQRGWKWMKEEFSWEMIANTMHTVYMDRME